MTLLAGRQQIVAKLATASIPSAPSDPSQPTAPPQPEMVMGSYFTSLKVNYSDIFITEVTVTYGEDTIPRVHAMDGATYTEVFDFRGNLQLQRIESPDDLLSEETFTYNYAGKQLTEEYVYDENGSCISQKTTPKRSCPAPSLGSMMKRVC